MLYLMLPLVVFMLFQLRKLNQKNKHLESKSVSGFTYHNPKTPIGYGILLISIFIFIMAVPLIVCYDLKERFSLSKEFLYIGWGIIVVFYLPFVLYFVSQNESDKYNV